MVREHATSSMFEPITAAEPCQISNCSIGEMLLTPMICPERQIQKARVELLPPQHPPRHSSGRVGADGLQPGGFRFRLARVALGRRLARGRRYIGVGAGCRLDVRLGRPHAEGQRPAAAVLVASNAFVLTICLTPTTARYPCLASHLGLFRWIKF